MFQKRKILHKSSNDFTYFFDSMYLETIPVGEISDASHIFGRKVPNHAPSGENDRSGFCWLLLFFAFSPPSVWRL